MHDGQITTDRPPQYPGVITSGQEIPSFPEMDRFWTLLKKSKNGQMTPGGLVRLKAIQAEIRDAKPAFIQILLANKSAVERITRFERVHPFTGSDVYNRVGGPSDINRVFGRAVRGEHDLEPTTAIATHMSVGMIRTVDDILNARNRTQAFKPKYMWAYAISGFVGGEPPKLIADLHREVYTNMPAREGISPILRSFSPARSEGEGFATWLKDQYGIDPHTPVAPGVLDRHFCAFLMATKEGRGGGVPIHSVQGFHESCGGMLSATFKDNVGRNGYDKNLGRGYGMSFYYSKHEEVLKAVRKHHADNVVPMTPQYYELFKEAAGADFHLYKDRIQVVNDNVDVEASWPGLDRAA